MRLCFWVIIAFITTCAAQLQHPSTDIPGANGCYQGHEGTFLWRLEGDNIYINISSTLLEIEWVAVGFSLDDQMGNDDVVAVHRNVTSGDMTVSSLINPAGKQTTVMQTRNSIEDFSVSYIDGVVTAYIRKSITNSYPLSNFTSQPVYLMFAKGAINRDNPATPIHKHKELPTISRRPVLLTEGAAFGCIATNTNTLLKLHGVIMVIVWLNMIPFSIFLARYARYYFTRHSLWFSLHKYSGILAGGLVFGSVVVAWYGNGKELELHRHQLVGLATILTLLLHLLMALCRPNPHTRFRRLWEISHRFSAVGIVTGSAINIINGLFMLQVHAGCYFLVAGQIVSFCLIFLLMENTQQVERFLARRWRKKPSYQTLNATFRINDNDSDDSHGDDITMVTINLDHSRSRSNIIKYSMITMVVLDLCVTAVLAGSISKT